MNLNGSKIPDILIAHDHAPDPWSAYRFAATTRLRHEDDTFLLIGFKLVPEVRGSGLSISDHSGTLVMKNVISEAFTAIPTERGQSYLGLGQLLVNGEYAGPGSTLELSLI
jgi:hypothetical protein